MNPRLTADEWHEAADLFEQGAVLAEHSSETHPAASIAYAVARMNSLAMYATGRAIDERVKAKRSPNTPSLPHSPAPLPPPLNHEGGG